jgi:hypothetical protein
LKFQRGAGIRVPGRCRIRLSVGFTDKSASRMQESGCQEGALIRVPGRCRDTGFHEDAGFRV